MKSCVYPIRVLPPRYMLYWQFGGYSAFSTNGHCVGRQYLRLLITSRIKMRVRDLGVRVREPADRQHSFVCSQSLCDWIFSVCEVEKAGEIKPSDAHFGTSELYYVVFVWEEYDKIPNFIPLWGTWVCSFATTHIECYGLFIKHLKCTILTRTPTRLFQSFAIHWPSAWLLLPP